MAGSSSAANVQTMFAPPAADVPTGGDLPPWVIVAAVAGILIVGFLTVKRK